VNNSELVMPRHFEGIGEEFVELAAFAIPELALAAVAVGLCKPRILPAKVRVGDSLTNGDGRRIITIRTGIGEVCGGPDERHDDFDGVLM
jgi:hypothetical protein